MSYFRIISKDTDSQYEAQVDLEKVQSHVSVKLFFNGLPVFY